MSGPARFFVSMIGAGIILILLSNFGVGMVGSLIVGGLGFLALMGALPQAATPGAKPPTAVKPAAPLSKEETDAYALWGVVTVFMLILMGLTWWFLSSAGPVAQYGRAQGGQMNRIVQPGFIGHDNPDQETVLRNENIFHRGRRYEIFTLEEGQCWVLAPTTETIEFRIRGSQPTDFEVLSPRKKNSRWCATQAGTLEIRVPTRMTLRFDRE